MVVLADKKEIAAFALSHRLHLALGYFDGVHRGHQALLANTAAIAAEEGGEPGVLLLEPHPQKVLQGDGGPSILTPPDEKIRLIRAYRDMHVFILPFDLTMAALSPEEFVRQYLLDLFHVRTAVCGYNYRFGHRGSGDSATLRRLAAESGFACSVLGQVTDHGKTVSSSEIRGLIGEGRMREAYSRLGHGHIFSGKVVGGRKLGARIGFPTANLELDRDLLWPAYGVYGGFVDIGQIGLCRGVINVGLRPTVNRDAGAPSFEVYLMDYHGDLYDRRLRVVLTDRLRPEAVFADLSALQAQIGTDVREASAVLSQWEEALRKKDLPPEAIFSCFINDYPI